MLTATDIINLFGGAPIIASGLNLERTSVYKWTYPKNKGGSGDRVPLKWAGPIINLAKARGITLGYEDVIPGEGDA